MTKIIISATANACRECEAWSESPANPGNGQCRKHPPQAALVPQQGIGGAGLAVVSYWPETRAGDGCFEFFDKQLYGDEETQEQLKLS